MASGPAPNHDFAPAWLKIPTNSQRPSVGATNNSNSDSGRRGDVSTFPARQKSSSGRDRGRSSTGGSPGIGFPPRQHSIDSIEESFLPSHKSGQGVAHEFRLSAAGQRNYSSSQPSLDRRSIARHNYRELGRPSSNLACSNIVSPGGRKAGHEESHHNRDGQWPLGRQRSFERGREGRNKDRAHRWKEEDIIQKFEQEFPSLVGGAAEDPSPAAAVTNGSVWDSGKIGKIHLSTSVSKKLHLVQKPIRNEISVKQRSSSPVGAATGAAVITTMTAAGATGTTPKAGTHASMMLMQPMKNGTSSVSGGGGTGNGGGGITSTATMGSMYRALLPSKGLMVRRSSKETSKTNGQSPMSLSSESSLGTKLVTQPSLSLTNKKSEFLKELKVDDGRRPASQDHEDDDTADSANTVDSAEKSNNEGLEPDIDISNGIVDGNQTFHRSDGGYVLSNEQPAVNGMQIERSLLTEATGDNWVLSSSLEAEQRLLREMGWKEEGSEDEGVYAPLTEDEVKEMEHLSKVFQKRNGMQRNLHVTWSPKRILPIPKNLDPANEDGSMSSSSTSSDSDSD